MDIEYTIECLPEYVPVRGNALASGDAAADRAAEDAILAQLERGNGWAWCTVRVIASVEIAGERYEADDMLGCCSYDSEVDFAAGPYHESMCAEARERLLASLPTFYAYGNGEPGCLFDHAEGPFPSITEAAESAAELLELTDAERADLATDGRIYFVGDRRHEVGAGVVEIFEVDADWSAEG